MAHSFMSPNTTITLSDGTMATIGWLSRSTNRSPSASRSSTLSGRGLIAPKCFIHSRRKRPNFSFTRYVRLYFCVMCVVCVCARVSCCHCWRARVQLYVTDTRRLTSVAFPLFFFVKKMYSAT
nr:hypothetical protein [Pandoravirus aubagnensis]